MNDEKRDKLTQAGWRVGDASEFLGTDDLKRMVAEIESVPADMTTQDDTPEEAGP